VNATANLNAGVWWYQYEVTPIALNVNVPFVNTFSVGNPSLCAYWGQWNNDGGLPPFQNAGGIWSVVWNNGTLVLNETVTFGYQSFLPPTFVPCSVLDGGGSASGTTLGMVPEPWTIISGCALIAPAGLMFRRRRRA